MSARKIARLLLVAAALPVATAWARSPSDSIEYFRRPDMKGTAAAIVCLNSRQSRNPLLFGHAALTTFKIESPATSSKNLESREAFWVGFWPTKMEDLIEHEDSEARLKSNLPYGAKGDFYKVFEKNEDNVKGERICHPVNAQELASMNDFLKSKRGTNWTAAYNCTDLAAEAFFQATGISFNARRPASLGASLPGTMANVVQRYRNSLDIKNFAKLDYTPIGREEIALLKSFEEAKLIEPESRATRTQRVHREQSSRNRRPNY